MTHSINLDTLRCILSGAQGLVEYHDKKAREAQAQNAALQHCGLAPIHSEGLLTFDRAQLAKYREHVTTLQAVIAFLEEMPAYNERAA